MHASSVWSLPFRFPTKLLYTFFTSIHSNPRCHHRNDTR
jgi:hypothetical protein